MTKLWCGTGNAGKLREFRLAGELFGIEIEPVPDLSTLAPCEETAETFEGNAILKAEYYGAHAPGLLFADDSGLAVDALGGAPGVYSARYAGPGATDADNNRLLLERMRGVENRAARFVCAIALSDRGRLVRTFAGEVEGVLLHEPLGREGFGYDPLFFYPPFGCSFAEVSKERKFEVSHRGKAASAMLKFINTRGDTL